MPEASCEMINKELSTEWILQASWVWHFRTAGCVSVHQISWFLPAHQWTARRTKYAWKKSSKWNSWILCAPALCGAARRCLSLSRRHCPGNYTAEASRSRWSGPTATREPSRGTWVGRGATGARSRLKTCWIDPWSLAGARRRGCTETGTGPWPAGGRARAAAAAGTRRASPPWPSGCHWRGRSRGCRPWPRPQPPRRGTEAGRGVWAAESPAPGRRWWSSCASSIWRVGSGTRPAEGERRWASQEELLRGHGRAVTAIVKRLRYRIGSSW